MKERKVVSEEYQQIMYDHHKKLKEIIKRAGPWDWCYGLDALVEHLRWMRDYYKLGENVLGMEKRDEDPKKYKNIPTRLETLEKTLGYYDKWSTLEEEYIKVVDAEQPLKEKSDNNGNIVIPSFYFQCKYKYRSAKKTYRKLDKAERKYKKKFFNMLCKHIEEWWD